jgi:hypothetical protein
MCQVRVLSYCLHPFWVIVWVIYSVWSGPGERERERGGVHYIWHHTLSLMQWLLHSLNWHTVDNIKQIHWSMNILRRPSTIAASSVMPWLLEPPFPPTTNTDCKVLKGKVLFDHIFLYVSRCPPCPTARKQRNVNNVRIILRACQCLCKRKICWSNPQAW